MALRDIKTGDIIVYWPYSWERKLVEVVSIELNAGVVVLGLMDETNRFVTIRLTPSNARKIKSPLSHEKNEWNMKKLKR